MWKKSSRAAAFLFCGILFAGQNLSRFEAAEPHMGTLFRITLYASGEAEAHAAFRAAFDRIGRLDDTLSDYKPESELMRLCRTAYQHPVRVSEDLFYVLERAQRLAGETGGAFDVTLGPVIRLWRDARRDKTTPDPVALSQAKGHTGYRSLVLDGTRRTVEERLPGMQLDLGAIAKGYAADEALRTLAALHTTRALVAASGDLAIGDAPPGKDGWRIGIDAPDASKTNFSVVLTLKNVAVSTSGDTEQYVEIGGLRYSHIIDPDTLAGLTRRVAVTVVASAGIEADSLATALSVLAARGGPEPALALAARHHVVSARVVTRGVRGWEVRGMGP